MTNPLFETLTAPLEGRETPLLHPVDGAAIGGADFLERVNRLAGAIRAAGMAPGDRLVAQLDKSPDALALFLACVQTGALFVPLNPAYPAAEVEYFIRDAAASVMLCAPKRAADLAPVCAAAGVALDVLAADGSGPFGQGAAPDAEVCARAPGDLAAMLYTSGTTGRPKGAMLTQDNLASNIRALVQAWRFTESDVLLHALPIFHTHGLFVAAGVALASGASMTWLPRFDAGEVLEHLPRTTAMMGVPTFYTRLLADDRFTREATSGMRLFTSGSAPMTEHVHARFQERTGQRILERYGMTETGMIASNPYEGERRAGTVGLPLDGVEARVVNAQTGAPLAPGETGVIEVRGPNVFAGYWGLPEKTAQEMREDGFFVTGDLGLFEPGGYLRIVGRQKDLIISGGLNVYPAEVERVMEGRFGIADIAVVAAPHPDLGEAVVGVYVAEEGMEPDEAAILEAMRSDLAPFKLPKRLVRAAELPRNAMGKVQKAALRESVAGLFANE